ncbi:MAG: GNAT family N-acetyltransferase [Ginsengibacter sp.]
MTNNILICPIKSEDDKALAAIIRASLEEFNAAKPGTVYFDETTDDLTTSFLADRSAYFVATVDKEVVGGGGIYPTKGLPKDTCELVKLYLSPAARGKGLGKMLIEHCIKAAVNNNYKKMYLETMPELITALPLYEKLGFTYIDGPMGNSGHNGCSLWMIKAL